MKKEQAKAYIEILDNLKRDLAEGDDKEKAIRAEVAKEIGDKIAPFKSGVYLQGGDELIVIPQSSLDYILKDYNIPLSYDCRKCKSFVLCSIDKQLFYAHSGDKCCEFKEANDGG